MKKYVEKIARSSYSSLQFIAQVNLQAGMDLLGGGGGCAPPLALARGGAGGVLFFMIKQKIIRGKMRYSNLSNNMMISEL